VQYDGSKLIGISKVDDEKELSQPPFSLMHFGVQTFSGKFRPDLLHISNLTLSLQ